MLGLSSSICAPSHHIKTLSSPSSHAQLCWLRTWSQLFPPFPSLVTSALIPTILSFPPDCSAKICIQSSLGLGLLQLKQLEAMAEKLRPSERFQLGSQSTGKSDGEMHPGLHFLSGTPRLPTVIQNLIANLNVIITNTMKHKMSQSHRP